MMINLSWPVGVYWSGEFTGGEPTHDKAQQANDTDIGNIFPVD